MPDLHVGGRGCHSAFRHPDVPVLAQSGVCDRSDHVSSWK